MKQFIGIEFIECVVSTSLFLDEKLVVSRIHQGLFYVRCGIYFNNIVITDN